MVLTNEGLGAALEVLAERTPRLVTAALPDGRFAAPVESAARRLRGAPALRSGDVTVDAARRDDGQLVVDVRAEVELIGEPTAIEDRVGALGGALIADRPPPARGCRAGPDRRRRVLLRGARPPARGRAASRSPVAAATPTRCCGWSRPAAEVALVDIRMPRHRGDDGLVAAQEIRRRHPDIGVLVLSHHLESRYAMRLLEEAPERGYLLRSACRTSPSSPTP